MISLPKTSSLKAAYNHYWGSLPEASHALVIAKLLQRESRPLLLITPDTASAYRLEQALKFFCTELPVKLLPDWETLPYDNFSPHEDIISDRLKTLSELPQMQQGVLVAPITTLMQRLAPASHIAGHSLQLAIGQKLNISDFRHQLENCGYRHVSTVYQHGEYTVRGSVLDLFPMGCHEPLRIDLFDDEIDSLRHFDPETQREIGRANV